MILIQLPIAGPSNFCFYFVFIFILPRKLTRNIQFRARRFSLFSQEVSLVLGLGIHSVCKAFYHILVIECSAHHKILAQKNSTYIELQISKVLMIIQR